MLNYWNLLKNISDWCLQMYNLYSLHVCVVNILSSQEFWTNIEIILCSFMCCFSKLGHITHYKAKKESTVKTNFCKCIHTRTHKHTVNRIAWRGDFNNIWRMWVCLMVWLCQGDCSKQTVQHKKNISKWLCVHRGKTMEVSEEECSWHRLDTF